MTMTLLLRLALGVLVVLMPAVYSASIASEPAVKLEPPEREPSSPLAAPNQAIEAGANVTAAAVAPKVPVTDVCRDPDCCLLRPAAPKGPFLQRFESAVGQGYDSLTAEMACQIFAVTYENCKTTNDDRYLLPDYVTAFPVLKTKYDQSASIYSSLEEAAGSIRGGAEASGGFSAMGIGAEASFSAEYQNAKKTMYKTNTSMMSTKFEHHGYNVIADTIAAFDPSFERRLDAITNAVKKNLTHKANYEAELVIRDCGTHVVTRSKLGAIVRQIAATASASFLGVASMKVSAHAEISKESKSEMEQSTRHSEIVIHGGPEVTKFAENDFKNPFLMEQLVPIPLGGVLVAELISDTTIRYEPAVADGIRNALKSATEKYLRENTLPGCTEMTNPSFNYQVTCEPVRDGTYSTPDYTATELFSGEIDKPDHVLGFFESINICFSRILGAVATLTSGIIDCAQSRSTTSIMKQRVRAKAYWCKLIDNNYETTKDKSMYFAGIVRGSDGNNRITGGVGCPPNAIAVNLLDDLQVCVIRGDAENSAGFGGFFSCKTSKEERICQTNYSAFVTTTNFACDITTCARPPERLEVRAQDVVNEAFEEEKKKLSATGDNIAWYNVVILVMLSVLLLIAVAFAIAAVVFCIRRTQKRASLLPSTLPLGTAMLVGAAGEEKLGAARVDGAEKGSPYAETEQPLHSVKELTQTIEELLSQPQQHPQMDNKKDQTA